MNRYRVGIVGAGGRSIVFSEYIAKNPDKAVLAGLADINIKKAQFISDYYGHKAEVFSDYKKLLERDDIDAIMLSTPDWLHKDIAVDSIASCNHVYLEKFLVLFHYIIYILYHLYHDI